MIRLFKRFFFTTIKRKYGYLKSAAKDTVEISGRALCSELELNPKVLRLSGVITTFADDAMLTWLDFLRLMCLFLLRKDVLQTRFEFILRFLHLTSTDELMNKTHIQDRA